jgi:uncharacterized protein (TIRG00374 family)
MKKLITFTIKVIIASVLIYYLFSKNLLKSEYFLTFFSYGNLFNIALSSLLFLFSQFLASVRIKSFLYHSNIPAKILFIIQVTFVGNFFNMVVPGLVGGDLVKGYYLVNSEKEMKGISSGITGIIVIDRLIGILALSLIAGISLFYLTLYKKLFLEVYQNEINLILYIIFSILIIAVTVFMVGRNKRIRSFIRGRLEAIKDRSFILNTLSGMAKLLSAPQLLVKTFILSLLIQFSSLLGILILAGLADDIWREGLSLLASSSVVMFVGLIPITPGNIGWTELVGAFAWTAVGSDAGARVFAYWRIIVILCSLPGGLIYILKKGTLLAKRRGLT